MRRSVAVVLGATSLVLMSPSVAHADDAAPLSGGNVTAVGGNAVVYKPGSPGNTPPPAGTTPSAGGDGSWRDPLIPPNSTCSYYDGNIGGTLVPINLATTTPGTLVTRVCSATGNNGAISAGTTYPYYPGVPPPPTPEQLAQMALARLVLPLPNPAMSPDPTSQIAGWPTWLAINNWALTAESASAGGVTVTVHGTPQRSVWSFPDGRTTTCTDGGRTLDPTRNRATDPTTCGFVPNTASFTRHPGRADPTETLTVAVTWQVRWTSNLGHNQILGNVTRTTTIPFRIWEWQATTR